MFTPSQQTMTNLGNACLKNSLAARGPACSIQNPGLSWAADRGAKREEEAAHRYVDRYALYSICLLPATAHILRNRKIVVPDEKRSGLERLVRNASGSGHHGFCDKIQGDGALAVQQMSQNILQDARLLKFGVRVVLGNPLVRNESCIAHALLEDDSLATGLYGRA